MKEELVKYLAGLLDADGSLSFAFKSDPTRSDHNFIGLVMSLASSDTVDRHGFVDNLPKLTSMGGVSRYGDGNRYKAWRVSKRADLEMLLPRLIKHMVIKARHWQWLLDEWRDRRRTTCNDVERDALKEGSKQSRLNAGPLKPKNHPTWAWLAGYLDGDGTYTFRQNPARGKLQWTINVSAVAHRNDMVSLEFLQNAFGGKIVPQGQSPDVLIWKRFLGAANRSFAERFLPNVAKHSRMKRHKIDAILNHHRQRLSVSSTKVQAIV